MSIAYIRKFYGLDFKIGQMVQIKKGASELLGVRTGKLVAAKGQYLTVRGDGWAGDFHPNDIEHVGQSQENKK